MNIQTIPVGALQENAYLVALDGRSDALLVDPGDDLPRLRAACRASGRALAAICLTHGHFDHILSAKRLRDETGAKIYIHALDAPALSDPALNLVDVCGAQGAFEPCLADGLFETESGRGVFSAAGVEFRVLHTPGHTKGSVCLYDQAARVLFSGDTLFENGCGRTDFPTGDPRAMAASLRALARLPGDVRLYPGHGASCALRAVFGGHDACAF